jgi:hypothetical protein
MWWNELKEAGSVKALSDCQLKVYEKGSDWRKAAADARYHRLQLLNGKEVRLQTVSDTLHLQDYCETWCLNSKTALLPITVNFVTSLVACSFDHLYLSWPMIGQLTTQFCSYRDNYKWTHVTTGLNIISTTGHSREIAPLLVWCVGVPHITALARISAEKKFKLRPSRFLPGPPVPEARINYRKMADKADKGKKRKRITDGTSKPSKRLALDADKQVKISHHEAETWAPVIGMNITSTSNSTFHYSASAPWVGTDETQLPHLVSPFPHQYLSNHTQNLERMLLKDSDVAETSRRKSFSFTHPHTQNSIILHAKKRLVDQMCCWSIM